MPTLVELETALRNADAAGDTEAATAIAQAIKAQQTPAPNGLATTDAPLQIANPFSALGFGKAAYDIPGTRLPARGQNFLAGVGKSVADTAQGGRQLMASLLDKVDNGQRSAALNAATAETNRLDKPLENDPYGKTGKIGMDLATSILPALLTGGGSVPVQMAKNVGLSTMQSLLSPSENYDLEDKAKWGAAWGVGGDVAGRALGRTAQMFRPSQSAATKENIGVLKGYGAPETDRLINQSDAPFHSALTNATEQIPYIGSKVTKAREANYDWYTRQATEGTGTPVGSLTQQTGRDMVGRLNAKGNEFRNGPDVPIPNVPSDLQGVADQIRTYAEATNKRAFPKQLDVAAQAMSPTTSGVINPATGAPFKSTTPPTMSAADVMDLRHAATKAAYGAQDPLVRGSMQRVRDIYDEALKSSMSQTPHPVTGLSKAQEFEQWLKEWGTMQDVKHAAGQGNTGLDRAGHVMPQSMAGVKGVDTFAPTSRMDQITTAAADRMPQPTPGWNRALITSLLLGAPIAGGAASQIANGDFSTGAVGAMGLSAAALRSIVGKRVDDSTIQLLRQLLAGSGGAVAHNAR